MSRLLQVVACLCFLATGAVLAFALTRGPSVSTTTAERTLSLVADGAVSPAPGPIDGATPTAEPSATEAPSPTATPTPSAPELAPSDIEALLDEIAASAAAWTADAEAGLAVVLDGEQLTGGTDEQVYSASSAKAIWVTAAAAAGVRIEELAEPIIEFSDNELTGQLLTELGIDPVNEFTANLGLDSTRLAGWPFAVERLIASDYDSGGRVNLTTATDLATFWSLLANDEIDGVDGPALVELFTVAPDSNTEASPYGGALTHRLPTTAAAATAHKGGWFPPDCCATEDRVMVTAGSVPLERPDASTTRYGLAVWVRNGESWDDGVAWVSWAACQVHALLSSQPLVCDRAGDPGDTEVIDTEA